MKMIALTFDDGFLKQLSIAHMLANMNINATFFCVALSKQLEGKATFAAHPELIQEIADMGHEIGSHTCTHRCLTRLNSSELEWELKQSKHILEDLSGKDVVGFAYPFGIFNDHVISRVSKYYSYARAAYVGDLFNIKPQSRYIIDSFGSSLKENFLKIVFHTQLACKQDLHPVLFAHDINIEKLLVWVRTIKLLGYKIVTLKELVEGLEDKGYYSSTK